MIDDGYTEITERDMRREEEFLSCINLERKIWVRFGFPMEGASGIVTNKVMRNLSGPPYVFDANRMLLKDRKHPQGVELKNVKVIFMHGGREQGKEWMFSSLEDGYPVVETVTEVNKHLLSKGDKPVSIVMACNEDTSNAEIKVGDFPPNSNIVYAVGETVTLKKAGMEDDGSIYFEAQAGDFWGLDILQTSQQEIEILD